jgi:serine/threonine-protein kinase
MQPAFQSSRYRILLELGQGGTAMVFLGVARGPGGFNKLVVLKVLKSGLNADQESRAMFLNEARLSARLSHPNIVQVNEVIEQAGQPVIVMEYLEGKPLSEVRSRAKTSLDLGMHLKVISEALGGLHYSHELADFDGTLLNVVHRDVSPHNVFVTFDGQVKVLDFGIAKLSRSLIETQTGVIKGKLRYMAPEQIAGVDVDRRADIYAAGVMLWEAATGTRMWAKMPETAIMSHVIGGNIQPPHEVRADVSPELERICMKALAREPNDRYDTAVQMQADIEALLGQMEGPSSLREVGQFVAELFRDSRSRVRQVIEQHLSQDSMGSEQARDMTFLPGSDAGGVETAVPAMPEPSARRNRLLVGFLMVAVALVAVVILLRGAGSPTVASSATTRAPADAPSPATTDARPVPSSATSKIAVRITAFPVAAQITLDGRRLDANPYSDTVMPDGLLHQVRATADGYEPQAAKVRFDRDVELVLTLNGAPSARQQYRARQRPAPPVTSAPPPKPVINCDPPFYVDQNGIKKFKPGCL